MNKQQLRQEFKQRRNAIDVQTVEQASRSIAWRLLRLPVIQRAGVVACYLSSGNEVATDTLIESLLAIGKTVAAPRVEANHSMAMARVDSLAKLIEGRYGLREPDERAAIWRTPESQDVCIVPAVALTERGERLGMGGGYYDRWLAENTQVTTIALAFESQLVPELPTEPHDVAMQWIVTESRAIACQPD